jgi:hypothetical protein
MVRMWVSSGFPVARVAAGPAVPPYSPARRSARATSAASGRGYRENVAGASYRHLCALFAMYRPAQAEIMPEPVLSRDLMV